MYYDKESKTVQPAEQILFSEIFLLQRVIEENKKGNLLQDCLFDSKVGLPGFEPRQTVPKTVVLPLHHNPILNLSIGVQK